MRSEGVVDLFQTVKLLRTQRPNMIQSQVCCEICQRIKTLIDREILSSFIPNSAYWKELICVFHLHLFTL